MSTYTAGKISKTSKHVLAVQHGRMSCIWKNKQCHFSPDQALKKSLYKPHAFFKGIWSFYVSVELLIYRDWVLAHSIFFVPGSPTKT
nr:hypothetical protein CFP56_05254 [Quercus suber]